jgi:peptide/nickel transport system substrate-binding protein
MAADEKEAGEPTEETPEVLPTSTEEAAPKKSKMLIAVVVVAILIIAAIGIAWMAGVFGGSTTTNVAPTVTTSMSTHAAAVGDVVTFNATATDTDGTIASVLWDFGDGTTATVANTTHAYTVPGVFIAYIIVTDNGGKTGDNEATLTSMVISVTGPAPDEPSTTDVNATAAPYLLLAVTENIIQMNATPLFDAGSSWAWSGAWKNASNHSKGIVWSQEISAVKNMTLNYSDGSALAAINTTAGPYNATHKFTVQGNHAVTLTGMSGSATSKDIRTVHVLKAAPPAGQIKNPDTFIEATIGEPDTLDPALDYETAGGEILQNVYETLVFYHQDSAVNLDPMLVTQVPTLANHGIAANGTWYNFTLRQGIMFHDGTSLTTADVLYSIQRISRLYTPYSPGWMVEQVLTSNVGAAFYKGKNISAWTTSQAPPAYLTVGVPTTGSHVITAADVDQVVANAVVVKDNYNFSIRLTHAYPGFVYIMAYTVMDIVSKDFVVAHGDDYMLTHTCGTGPYQLVSWEKNSAIRMLRNDNYWRTPASIKNVVIMKVEDVNTRQLLLKAGDADSAYIPIQFESQFSDATVFNKVKGLPTFNVEFLSFNFNINVTDLKARYGNTIIANVPIQTANGCDYSNFFNDTHIRKAFSVAFDYNTYLASAYLGNAQQLNGAIPQGMLGYNASIPKQPYNLTLAKSQLENSTYGDLIALGFTVPLFYNSGNTYREAACNILKDALESLSANIHINIVPVTWATYIPMMNTQPSAMPAWFVGWAPDYADPDDYVLPFLHSTLGIYPYGMSYANTSLDLLIEQAAGELNTTKRAQEYSNITIAANHDLPYIWLDQGKNFHIERAWIHGYYFNPMYSGFYYYQFSK